jgi:hypothetical protein
LSFPRGFDFGCGAAAEERAAICEFALRYPKIGYRAELRRVIPHAPA